MNESLASETPHPITSLPLFEFPIPVWAWFLLAFLLVLIFACYRLLQRGRLSEVSEEALKQELLSRLHDIERSPARREALDHFSLALRRYLSFRIYGSSFARDFVSLQRACRDDGLALLLQICRDIDGIRFAPTTISDQDLSPKSLCERARRALQ
ncbi:MAG: hypothetical protein KDD64_13255 [Bdellovibrionales bacterium]|nr:hypothetical protein [Bdellovibrionales bacterium]